MRDDYLKLYNKNWDYFTILLDKSQDVFWIVNTDYSVQIYVSPAFEQVWGYQPSVLYENPLFWLETIVEEDRHRLATISRLPHACVMSFYSEKYRIVTASGEIRWILDHTYPILNKMGQCIGYAGIAQDVTNTTKLESELRAANKFLPKLAEKMDHTAFWVRDASLHKQLYLSKGFEKIWGLKCELFYSDPGAWLETLVPEDRLMDAESMLAAVYEKGGDVHFDNIYRIKRPSGELRWIHDISFPIFDDEHKVCIGFAGIAEDITQEKLYEMELQLARDRAEAANVAKSNFIASMSHDFRTPLNGLLGMAEILRSGRCYPEQVEYVEAIMQAGNTLLDLVEDIINYVALDLNKLPIQLEWFDLEKLVGEIILTLSPQAHQKKVEMILNFSEGVPKEVYGDLSRVRRILMNLINNAVKFTSDGHVLINVELQRKAQDKVWLQFMVEDTGIGISKENFEYIFGSFNRIEPSYSGRYKGTGLGLTIVKQFISDLNGTIKLSSELDRGSVFYCSIPFVTGQGKVNPDKLGHFTHLKSLVVDDYVRRAETFVKQFGLKNSRAAVGNVAVGLVEEANRREEPYQLIILSDDIQENVLEIGHEIRQIFDGTLMLIAEEDSGVTLDLLRSAGYDDVITKPLKPLAVEQGLENALLMRTVPFSQRYNVNQEVIARNVLLVEDDMLTQKITSWMLEELQCRVEIAGTGTQALSLMDKKFDLIIMDVGLPDMDGITLAGHVRSVESVNQHTPIVALTAHVMETDKEKCLAVGMNDFLKKPLFKKDLKNLLLKLFAQSTIVSNA